MQYEEAEQAALFEWAAYETAQYPELAFMFHIPNGGKRDVVTAANLKRMGVKPGVPDIFLPVTRGPYAGLFIEMKHGKNQLTREQRAYLDALAAEGYDVAVCYSFQEAVTAVTRYLRGPRASDSRVRLSGSQANRVKEGLCKPQQEA